MTGRGATFIAISWTTAVLLGGFLLIHNGWVALVLYLLVLAMGVLLAGSRGGSDYT
jgi:cellobiose-specific phosphotransferase system component IIC